ncbi:hypothetical protein A3J78_02495 [Candidatus Beckwithbacteria bacterium RBG_13_35_6]|uniref:Fido domain-containing protein n=1 Tax=Candidatus Beckwithbacteria bacterium RBG_13_35_6 TaxID=1797456 RepID=A0A1F5DG05_9BACT|nr:MAG: hypothetical protein A3J78_02495 [Candidatus Beckwithbacteria bacterium RBG_13_35_6]
MQIIYLSFEQVIFLHEKIIVRSGGLEGIRDFGLLYSAIERPKASFASKDLYASIFDKAAALTHSLILNHPFIDGNKRTALASLIRFLEINQKKIKANKKEFIELSLKIENKKMNFKDIVGWLKEHAE